MAGANIDTGAKGGKGDKKRRKKRRLSIRIDMTPMVDIVMLLLIFYMVTTVFTMPQAMEMNLPPDSGESPPVSHNRLLVLRVDCDNNLFWNRWDPADSLPKMIGSTKTDSLINIIDMNHRMVGDSLNTLVLIHPEADYELMVDILDDIDRYNRKRNEGLDIGCFTPSEQIKALRFSYRFAIGEWESRDTKIVSQALFEAKQGR